MIVKYLSQSYRVVDTREHGLEEGKLRVDAEEEQHEEEHDGEELGHGQLGQGIRIGNEGQSLASSHQLLQLHSGLLALGPEDGEHEDAGDDAGEEVEGGDDGGGYVDLVLELVIASEHKETAPGDRERKEHLLSSLSPHLA